MRVGLRMILLVALLLGLNMPHLGMASTSQTMAMTMVQANGADQPMDHGAVNHEKMNGFFCATVCFGTSPFAALVSDARAAEFTSVRWQGAADLLWVSPTPDPALRPPDLLPSA